MKREILLSPACRAPQLWGYTGEKEHTLITVELPEDITACNFYRAEITIKGKLFRTDYLEILDGKVCFELTSTMVETSGIITAQIIGYVVDENGDIEEIGKTEIYKGNIKKSSSGKLTSSDSNLSLLDCILAKVHVLIKKMHEHLNKKTLDGFYCQSLETGIEQDASSSDLKWNGASLRFAGEGAVVSRVEPTVNDEGKPVFRLWLDWGNSQFVVNKRYIDIPVEEVKDTVIENGDVILNGSELSFTMGTGGTGLTEEEIATAIENYFAENPISGGGYSMAVEGETLTVTANAGGAAPTVENETIIF